MFEQHKNEDCKDLWTKNCQNISLLLKRKCNGDNDAEEEAGHSKRRHVSGDSGHGDEADDADDEDLLAGNTLEASQDETEALILIPKVAAGDLWGKVPKDPTLLKRLKITVMRKKKREAEVAEVGQRLPTPTWRVMMRSMPSRRGNLETQK